MIGTIKGITSKSFWERLEMWKEEGVKPEPQNVISIQAKTRLYCRKRTKVMFTILRNQNSTTNNKRNNVHTPIRK